jgi:hypothetical protein
LARYINSTISSHQPSSWISSEEWFTNSLDDSLRYMSHGSHDCVPERNRSEKIPWYWVLASRIYFEGTPSIFSTSLHFYHKTRDCCNSIWNLLPNMMPARKEQHLVMGELKFCSMRILQPSRTRPPSRSRHVEVQEADSTSSLSRAWVLQALPEFESGPIRPELELTGPRIHSISRHHSKGTSHPDIISTPLFGHRDLPGWIPTSFVPDFALPGPAFTRLGTSRNNALYPDFSWDKGTWKNIVSD